ncbi:MAG: hypothetical protein ACRDVG_07930 [Jatrophihabitantaceae bacterium]
MVVPSAHVRVIADRGPRALLPVGNTRITKPNFPTFDLNIPDQYRAAMFPRVFAKYVKDGNLPALNLMWVMNDHTSGTSPGVTSPDAFVADNEAVGRIVDTISHSPYWKNSAIFVVEDD